MDYKYLLFIPFAFSILSCTTFLYLFFRHEAVKLTFLMKYISVLITTNLFLSLSVIFLYIVIYPNNAYCEFFATLTNSLFIYQSYWVAVISVYSYKVLCLGIDRNTYSVFLLMLKFLIILIFPEIFSAIFQCHAYEDNKCKYVCKGIIASLNLSFRWIFVIGFTVVGCFNNVKILYWLRNNLRHSSIKMKLAYFRIIICPFINVLCILPNSFYFWVYVQKFGNNEDLEMIFVCFLFLNGAFNSALFGFSPEFRDALKFGEKNKKISFAQELMD